MADKRYIVILGAGESGVGAALLAQKEGYAVLLVLLVDLRERRRKLWIM